MAAVGTTGTMESLAIHSQAIQPGTVWEQDRLPWSLAMPVIGVLSLGLWLGIWQFVRLAVGA